MIDILIKLHRKLTKRPQDIWLASWDGLRNPTIDARDAAVSMYSPQENIDIVSPYINYILSLPGKRGYDRTYLDDNTLRITRYFDTKENARNYHSLVHARDPATNTIISDWLKLIEQKRLAAGNDPYTIETTLELGDGTIVPLD